jgi:signal recognition particle receptor subunit beta
MSGFLAPFLPPHLADKQEAIVAIMVILISMVLLMLWSRSSIGSKGGRTVVISGPCSGGKTRLFHALTGVHGVVETVASMQENIGACQIPGGGSMRVVDVPGHERLRHKLDLHLRDAR